jgi:tRNA pseudouridine55 synthase
LNSTKKLMNSTLLLLNKNTGVTSFEALKPIKRALGSGKVGHTGTLDKFAEGLLVVLSGRALKLSQYFLHADKHYLATVYFGAETDTLDPEGSVIFSGAPPPARDALEAILGGKFTGTIEQVPPMYSAIHIDGKRAYQIARGMKRPSHAEGKPESTCGGRPSHPESEPESTCGGRPSHPEGEAESTCGGRPSHPESEAESALGTPKSRLVTIHSLKLLSYEPPLARLAVHCSSGTYIRALARDIALALGSRAHLVELRRTAVGLFSLEDAISCDAGEEPEALAAKIAGAASPLDKKIFAKIGIPSIEVDAACAQAMRFGKPLGALLPPPSEHEATLAVFCEDVFIAVITRDTSGSGKIWRYGYVNGGSE